MGYYISSILSSIQNYCFQRKFFIPIIGPRGSGKTLIINKLKSDMGLPILPNIGFSFTNSNSLNYKRLQLEENYLFFKGKGMTLWKYYIPKIDAIILVLDSCDKESLKESSDLFWEFFAKSNKNFPMLIFANKQNIEGALSLDDIRVILNLNNLTERPWKIFGIHNYNIEEIYKGLDWLETLL